MKHLLQKARIQHLIQHRNGYLALASGSLLLNMLLSVVLIFMIGHERIVLVPPSIEKSFWVSASQVSPVYLSEMSLFFSNLRFNMTPSNAAMQRDVLLKYVHPQHYDKIKTGLLSEADKFSQNTIATAFYVVDIKVNTQKLVAQVEGDLQSTVGNAVLPSQRVKYKIAYAYNNGRLLVRSFDEVKADA